MVAVRHLTKAPAQEALIDIQFGPAASMAAIDRFVSVAEGSFAQRSDLMHALVGLGNANVPPQSTHSIIGRRLDSVDPPHVLQCRTTGFTFSRLSPYGEWRDLREAAKGWWDKFAEIVNPEVVTRVAVRYVNSIDLPVPVTDFGDYLVCPPRVPASLPQSISGFLSRIVMPDPENNCTTAITQALEGLPTLGGGAPKVAILLDIDVFRDTHIDRPSLHEVWTSLDVLRDQKNRVFFEHLTEKAMELFQ